MPALRARHIKLWDAPEFSCKYWGFTLPNECTTVWHGVYADVPVLVNQHDHIDVDVPRVTLTDTYISVGHPALYSGPTSASASACRPTRLLRPSIGCECPLTASATR